MRQTDMINIAEILKDCPTGTKLYSPVFGECTLNKVLKNDGIIQVDIDNGESFDGYFNENGQLHFSTGECLLFPSKDNRDWSTFKKPCIFKPFDKVVARFAGGTWSADLFSHYWDKMDAYITMGGVQCDECLPYNEETAKLLGTNNNYDKI